MNTFPNSEFSDLPKWWRNRYISQRSASFKEKFLISLRDERKSTSNSEQQSSNADSPIKVIEESISNIIFSNDEHLLSEHWFIEIIEKGIISRSEMTWNFCFIKS